MKQKTTVFKSVTLFLLLAFFQHMAWAQAQNVTGKVTDALDGTPLIGVTVVVKGTNLGTTTDGFGSYSINVEPTATLVFSYIGYETLEEAVNGRSTINVLLNQAV